MKVDKILKEDCEKNGDYCNFHRRFLKVLNRVPSVSNYNEWSQKKFGSIAQHVQVKSIKDAVHENLGKSLDELPKTANEFLTRFEDYDFTEFFREQLETLDDGEAPTVDKDDNDYLDLDAKFVLLERFYNLMKEYSEKPTAEEDNENDEEACKELYKFLYLRWFSELYDGPYLSLGKIYHIYREDQNIPDSESMFKLEGYVDSLKSKCDSEYDEMDPEVLKEKLIAIKRFIDVKKFDDGFSSRKENPSFCASSNVSTTNQCRCECHKVDKVAIYNIYAAIQMIQKDLNIQSFGDVYTYYYYDAFRQHPAGVVSTFSYPLVNESLADEINAFERDVLKELRFVIITGIILF